MVSKNLIWPLALHHLCLATENLSVMTLWYKNVMGMSAKTLTDGLVWLSGSQRNILLTIGKPNTLRYAAFSVKGEKQLMDIKNHLISHKLDLQNLVSPLFKKSGFAFVDPDGNNILLGVPKLLRKNIEFLPARLQHVVFATNQLKRNVRFYTDTLGFKISDIVREDTTGEDTACFLRSNKMHHSIAFFRSPKPKLDHFASETNCWNDIRDWGDHFAKRNVEIVWGAGRHGAGNNLFIFVRDPDRNNVEISAELEVCSYNQQPRIWSHGHRPLNLWGQAWMRS